MMLTLLLAALLAQAGVPTDAEGEAAAKKLREDCAKLPIEGKIVALQEAAMTEHERVIKAIGEMLLTEADAVRIAGANALASVDHPASADVLLNALLPNLKREDVVTAILKAIAELGWQTPAHVLNQLVAKVGEPEIRAILPAVITTLGDLGSATSIDPLIDLLMKLENGARRNPWPNEGGMRKAGEDALRRITGVDQRRVQEWETWWRANQEIVKTKGVRTYWIRKTQDRIDVAHGEKTPLDSILVASRLHAAPTSTAQVPKKKKKGTK